MHTNDEITTIGNSDIVPSKDINNKIQSDVIPVNSNSDLTSESDIPSFTKILVTYDGSEKSDKAINYAVYLSNISKAEIVILQVIGNIDKLENSSIDVSNKEKNPESGTTSTNTTNNSDLKGQTYSVNIEGKFVKSMEDKIKDIENTGFKNKISFKIRAGFIIDEIVKETHELKYDLLIISSSHMDSWISSLFSETRKIIGKVELPVLLLH
ncbi:universal stress protein [Candidatus Nitrosocosmicus hydrocola]|uniref:universal stress protein n=1 Tax=Candidatus Nitrosocosmicus hydrocola TaxID=1826872 RepID=UPI001372F66A|nr:universal stress protein [Candidatus Nitrosocosmicus hydrocola]